MDPGTIILMLGLMVLLGVLLVNAVVAGTVMRLERFRMVREREREQHEHDERKLRIERGETLPPLPSASAEAPVSLPRAVNAYIAALLVTGVPTMSFFAALFGGVSGWAWIAAGGASIAAVVAAITLCALPEKNEAGASSASKSSKTSDSGKSDDSWTITPGFTPSETNAENGASPGTNGPENEQRGPRRHERLSSLAQRQQLPTATGDANPSLYNHYNGPAGVCAFVGGTSSINARGAAGRRCGRAAAAAAESSCPLCLSRSTARVALLVILERDRAAQNVRGRSEQPEVPFTPVSKPPGDRPRPPPRKHGIAGLNKRGAGIPFGLARSASTFGSLMSRVCWKNAS
jgi:hypothetical protein